MSSKSKPKSSRTPPHKQIADVNPARTPLKPSAEQVGFKPPPKKSSCCCFCCCKKTRAADKKSIVGKEKTGSKQQKGKGSYSVSSGKIETRDGTLESGITGLSQVSDLPRFESDFDDIETITTDNSMSSRGEPQKKKSSNSCLNAIRKIIKVLCSVIGISLVVALYSVGGAFLFSYLEKEGEKTRRNTALLNRNKVVDSLWNLTVYLNVFHEVDWKDMTDKYLVNFEQQVYKLTQQGWDGKDNTEDVSSWSFASALLYSLTVITTIGYGNVTPKTVAGRILTILYAIFGIPLFVIWLASLGSIMATAFRFLYVNISHCCAVMCNCRKRRADAEMGTKLAPGEEAPPVRVPIYLSFLIVVLYIILGAVLFSEWENWEISEAAYFCFITLATIGFGDFVPGFGSDKVDSKAIGNAVYLVLGLALLSMCFDLMREEVVILFNNALKSVSKFTSDTHDIKPKRPESKKILAPGKGKGHPPAVSASSHRARSPSPRGISSIAKLNLNTSSLPESTRHSAASAASTRYGPMPHGVEGGGTLVSRGPPSYTSCCNSSNNNNSNNNVDKNALDNGTEVVARPKSVPPQALPEPVDLLEHVTLGRNASPQESPKMHRRDRSRSPVRGRPKSRGPSIGDKGGNVDVATEEEEDDDDDTLDAASVASSTDLIKVAHAVRRERSEQPSSPVVSPATFTLEDALPAYSHSCNNVSMSTFRPAPPNGTQVQARALIPTTSRPASRCQSRARSSSPVSRTVYQQGYDALTSSRTSSAGEEERDDEMDSVYAESCRPLLETAADTEVTSRSAFSKPGPSSSLDVEDQPPNFIRSREQQHQQQQQLEEEKHRQQELQQQQQRQQQLRQEQLRQQQQQQRQQQQQQHPQKRPQQHHKQANKIHSTDNILPPRCLSPRPKLPKTPQHKVAPPADPTLTLNDSKRPPPPTMPKSKKMAVVSQPL